jgi:tetratricopeptide (TPR) repeat protein
MCGLVLVPLQAAAWSARKPQAPRPKQTEQRPATAAPLSVQVAEALRRPQPAALLKLLRLASAAHETLLVHQLADTLAGLPHLSGAMAADAAALVAEGPAAHLLWRRAFEASPHRPARAVVEGYVDSLTATGDIERAAAIVESALGRTPRGQRRPLLERWVVLARNGGELPALMARLTELADPDADVVLAGLHGELGDDDAALTTLRAGWRKFPGHRALQAALTQALARGGAREELAQVLTGVVKLAPQDPMPWLTLLDAHVAARDTAAVRQLSDDLARRHPRHIALLEALIDRAQRVGEPAERVGELFARLLQAAPRATEQVEAYAEWLLDQGRVADARAALGRVQSGPQGELSAWLREAELLSGHGLWREAREVAERVLARRAEEPKAQRLLAVIDERQGRNKEAAARWRQLTVLPPEPGPGDRTRAQDARHALANLHRRDGSLTHVVRQLAEQARATEIGLSSALLFLDLQPQLEPAGLDSEWRTLASRWRAQFGQDPEVLSALASGWVTRRQWSAALDASRALAGVEPAAAEPLLVTLVEEGLARGDVALVAAGEGLLVPAGGRPLPSVLLKLGDAHLHHGDSEGAAALYKRAAAGSSQDTRAVAKLATLFRLAGARQDEARALRDIVLHATDADELESAGQRLVTLALAGGQTAELVRWLDAALPQHPRRDVLERFRVAAYDAWLRLRPLDRALQLAANAPAGSSVADALASGELALQVRALRQMALLARPVPLTAARGLLRANSGVLRRDTALALAVASGEQGAQAVAEVVAEGLDPDDDVLRAELYALLRLPPQARLLADLARLTGRDELAGLAALVSGRGGAADAGRALLEQAQSSRVHLRPAAIVALGLWLAAQHDRSGPEPERGQALELLVGLAHGDPSSVAAPPPDLMAQAAALWALAVAGGTRAQSALQAAFFDAADPRLAAMALRLWAAPTPPDLRLPEVAPGDSDGLRELRARILRQTLSPWLDGDADVEAEVIAARDLELAAALTQPGNDAAVWCARWRGRWRPSSAVARVCAAQSETGGP